MERFIIFKLYVQALIFFLLQSPFLKENSPSHCFFYYVLLLFLGGDKKKLDYSTHPVLLKAMLSGQSFSIIKYNVGLLMHCMQWGGLCDKQIKEDLSQESQTIGGRMHGCRIRYVHLLIQAPQPLQAFSLDMCNFNL